MATDPLLVMLWIAALRRRSLGTVLAQVETYPTVYRPPARAYPGTVTPRPYALAMEHTDHIEALQRAADVINAAVPAELREALDRLHATSAAHERLLAPFKAWEAKMAPIREVQERIAAVTAPIRELAAKHDAIVRRCVGVPDGQTIEEWREARERQAEETRRSLHELVAQFAARNAPTLVEPEAPEPKRPVGFSLKGD